MHQNFMSYFYALLVHFTMYYYANYRYRGSNIDQYYKRHSGDMIVAIDGHNVTKAEDFMSYIDGHKTPGDSVNLTVYRDDKMLNLIATLKPWPALAPYIHQATLSSNPE
jgi:PDZ domain-containing secreted protein